MTVIPIVLVLVWVVLVLVLWKMMLEWLPCYPGKYWWLKHVPLLGAGLYLIGLAEISFVLGVLGLFMVLGSGVWARMIHKRTSPADSVNESGAHNGPHIGQGG